MKKIENSFTVTGYIATDAEIHQFAESTKATFALSIGRRENKNGQEVWSSVLANVELWRKNSSAQDLENLKKGLLVTVEGYFRPEQWTGKDGEQGYLYVAGMPLSRLIKSVTTLECLMCEKDAKEQLQKQLDEEKANADAERQFEKDFAKLSFRRDWRTAKNLSVDQEAVRRVGLAREEEAAAKKAVAETAANTKRAADAVEEIAKAIEETDNVD